MAKQTFTTGQVLTAAQMTSLQQTAMGGGSATAKTASYVLVAADAGTTVAMNAAGSTTITVNTSLFAAGDTVFIQNLGAGVCTVTAGTATVSTAGSLVLAQNQGGELYFTSASAAVFFQYATPASSGDIEGVTAGTGISGGGTSGTVTVTNSMATAIDAKGDLVVGTGADTFSRLAVGTDTYTLVADSAEATGLKWAAPSAASGDFVLITSASFSAVSQILADVIFTSTYKRYVLYITFTDNGAVQTRMAFRYGTTTESGDYYGSNFLYNRSNTLTTYGGAPTTGYLPITPSGVGAKVMNAVFGNFGTGSSVEAYVYGNGIGRDNQENFHFAAKADASRNYNGFIITCVSGTFTGTYSVYGLKD